MEQITTLYYNDSSSYKITGILDKTLTNPDISNNASSVSKTLTDISGVTIGTNVIKLADEVFSGCSNLNNITIYNTDIITHIGNDIFQDICGNNGIYRFYSNNNYYTSNILQLISLLPVDITTGTTNWVNMLDNSYNYYTDFSVLCDSLTLETDNTQYYYFTPIDISYQDFHSLFFTGNGYITLNKFNNNPNYVISTTDFKKYTTINLQQEYVYLYGDTSYDISFNFAEKVLRLYNSCIPLNSWDTKSSIVFNNKISNLKTIFDFDCNIKNTKLTIDDFFNILESQGMEIATDNSYNSIPKQALGLPIDAEITKYTAILNLFLKSHTISIPNICFKMPYLINFSDSLPINSDPNINNYRYNPYYK